MDCLSDVKSKLTANENSWVKFARQIIQTMILEPKGFKIQFFESLILAQDERWRRA